MEPTAKLSRDDYVRMMRDKLEAMLSGVADAVNEAPPGSIISGSEERVRDLLEDFRKEAFETALQMRVDAAEAAFPPSDGREDRQVQTE